MLLLLLLLCLCRARSFRHAGGVEDWAVRCVCGTADDDGEHMIVCDACGFWMHTRCNGLRDDDADGMPPGGFVCGRCREARAAAEATAMAGAVATGVKRGRH